MFRSRASRSIAPICLVLLCASTYTATSLSCDDAINRGDAADSLKACLPLAESGDVKAMLVVGDANLHLNKDEGRLLVVYSWYAMALGAAMTLGKQDLIDEIRDTRFDSIAIRLADEYNNARLLARTYRESSNTAFDTFLDCRDTLQRRTQEHHQCIRALQQCSSIRGKAPEEDAVTAFRKKIGEVE